MLKCKFPYLLIISLIIFNSCIEEFVPEINSGDNNLYVIQGYVSNVGGFHSIYISKSSKIQEPSKIPVSNCIVKIFDDNDNVFEAEEYEEGEYKAYIDQSFLTIGTAFKIEVTTPEGELLSSTYDTLRYCPPIDSVYYTFENFLTNDPEETIPGIQFYMNYDGLNSNTKKIKINIDETWEIRSKYPIRWIWDGNFTEYLIPPDVSKKVCWKTNLNKNIYLIKTDDFTNNLYKNYPLHNIFNTSEKLVFGYSVLITQLSISNSIYNYYKKVQANILTDKGLYETQPQLVEGNITNLTNGNIKVLGSFYAAGVETKRIYIGFIKDFLNYKPVCEPIILDFDYRWMTDLHEPMYLWLDPDRYAPMGYWLTKGCVDCTSRGGSTVKPEFWPN